MVLTEFELHRHFDFDVNGRSAKPRRRESPLPDGGDGALVEA
jgi:hypothetical protein